jgi:predicted ATP-grasp superfamily ATP-dependent carboligase
MTRIFVYEYMCGGGLRPAEDIQRAASLCTEGRAMLTAVLADFGRVPGVGVHTILDERLRGDWPAVEGIRRIAAGDEESAFREEARSADWSLVIAPEFDRILETRCRWVLDEGGRLLGPSPDAVALTADKLVLTEHLERAGVPTPRTLAADASPLDMPSFPWVLKPRFGAGSQETEKIDGQTAFSTSHGELGEKVIQPFIPGRSASVAFLIGRRQTIAMEPASQHLSDDGRFAYCGGSLPLPTPLADRALGIARRAVDVVPGLFGYVGVDVVLGERDWVIEINPRLTTSYVGLRALAVENLAELMLRVARGESVAKPHWRNGEVRFTAVGEVERDL